MRVLRARHLLGRRGDHHLPHLQHPGRLGRVGVAPELVPEALEMRARLLHRHALEFLRAQRFPQQLSALLLAALAQPEQAFEPEAKARHAMASPSRRASALRAMADSTERTRAKSVASSGGWRRYAIISGRSAMAASTVRSAPGL